MIVTFSRSPGSAALLRGMGPQPRFEVLPQNKERRRGSFPNSLPRRRRLCPPRRTEARRGRYVRHLERGVTQFVLRRRARCGATGGVVAWSHHARLDALAGQGAAVKTDRPKLCDALRRGLSHNPKDTSPMELSGSASPKGYRTCNYATSQCPCHYAQSLDIPVKIIENRDLWNLLF